jgi:hypothetical protein
MSIYLKLYYISFELVLFGKRYDTIADTYVLLQFNFSFSKDMDKEILFIVGKHEG